MSTTSLKQGLCLLKAEGKHSLIHKVMCRGYKNRRIEDDFPRKSGISNSMVVSDFLFVFNLLTAKRGQKILQQQSTICIVIRFWPFLPLQYIGCKFREPSGMTQIEA